MSIEEDLWTLIRQKDQRIAELEEENKNLNLCRCCECKSENEYMLQNTIRDLEEENAELKEQMKNAIVPKYKVGDEVFVNLTDMDFVKKTFCLKISGIDYRYILETRPYGRFDERDLFDTEAEAQKYLEQQNEIHSKC